MKQSILLLIASIYASISLSAQTIENNEANNSSYPVVTKGYYSIGKNAQKLNTGTVIVQQEVVDNNSMETAKGYYSIKGKNGNRKRHILYTSDNTLFNSINRPVITKGYYSIGNNARKLQK